MPPGERPIASVAVGKRREDPVRGARTWPRARYEVAHASRVRVEHLLGAHLGPRELPRVTTEICPLAGVLTFRSGERRPD